jgi:hypothetical protein
MFFFNLKISKNQRFSQSSCSFGEGISMYFIYEKSQLRLAGGIVPFPNDS